MATMRSLVNLLCIKLSFFEFSILIIPNISVLNKYAKLKGGMNEVF